MKYKVALFWCKLHPNLPHVQNGEFFEKLYQDLFDVPRMLHH